MACRADRDSPRAFHVTVKAVGPACNLACTYCYYLHKEQLLGLPGLQDNASISDELLETFIRQYINAQQAPLVIFTWHGGEPTLLGLEFYRKAVRLQQKHARAGVKILNDIQTNGILLDDAWCAFFREHDFLVGLSIELQRHAIWL